MSEPAFTVIMPTRDRPDMLAVAVQSVVSQTFTDWELIIVDDAGLESAVVPSDARIKLIRHAVGRGPAAARNSALAVATGKYIAFLDDDDAWAAKRLERAFAAHTDADLVICGSGSLANPSAESHPTAGVPRLKKRPHDWILNRTSPPLGCVTISAALCPAFSVDYKAAEDLDWWLRSTRHLGVACLLPERDWLWRRHDGPRIGIGTQKRIDGSLKLLSDHRDYFGTHRRAKAFRLRRIGVMSLQLGEANSAKAALWSSLAVFPSARTLKSLAKAFWCGLRGQR